MKQPLDIGLTNGRLSPCPSSPNCVSSDARDKSHRIDALELAADPAKVWAALKKRLAVRPRTRIVTVTDDYLHAQEKSRIFGFVDDIEFHLRPAEQIIAIRSASRVGYSDFGVNRRRVEEIRRVLHDLGLVESQNR
ncbi:MAG: DUF1499 domain-containing protein [Desulfobacterales bacterium]|nr:DUF1499 domain-containing protein [Desulfobacterales bacterium]MCF8079184.1 DUF1499 domain-containing protein [Desulfobacterales bacterium]